MLTKLTDHIYISDFDSNNDRPRLAYINGGRFNIMIDAGNSPAHFELFMSDCKQFGLKEPDYILITHWHWDHVFGLAGTNIPAICSELTQEKLKQMQHWKRDNDSMQDRLTTGEDIEFCDANMRIEYPDCLTIKVRLADFTFTDELEIDCGGIRCVMKLIRNDHASDSCVIYIPEEKMLFLGDIISPDYHHGNPHYTSANFYSLWKTLMAYDFDYAIHGHTDVFNKQTLNNFFEDSIEMIKGSNI